MFKILSNLLNENEREIRRLSRLVQQINALEQTISPLSDDELKAKTPEFKERLERGESLDSLLPEAFAVVREVARRVLDMRHFDVQLMGGIVLHEGRIAEMKTGEGKTLVETLPAYLNALMGEGVHIVTVNDYLAKRDSEWMGGIYKFLGLSVGLILHDMGYVERQKAYMADVTYGTNNEFGFDYLRDNMVLSKEHKVQRVLNYAIIDEVDSILIDEARTPLIISGPSEKSTDMYYTFAKIVRYLKRDVDYVVDEKARTVAPTEAGIAKVEKMLNVKNLYDDRHMELSHYLIQALKAEVLMHRDKDYVVKDGQVIIVDEFTGRLMYGRRYSDGLHQAIEAKEGVKIERETRTLATITFQNFFRMYKKRAGMTGTAATEEDEFRKIYGMDVVVIPTNEPMIRVDLPDVILKTERAKFKTVVREIVERHKKGQPVLVGTTSIEKSEKLSEMLKREGISHQVLNAKYHEKEAEIIARAGQRGTVTIATNMAGRGTDIVLGEGVAELGGLHVLGTERHEARRIDNQLRGRSGRQGDPGSSRFYLSLEDDLMRMFGSDIIAGLMTKLGISEDEPIDHPLVSRAIETAQKRLEARNFEIRRQVLQYDDVINKQRELIYQQRDKILEGSNLKENVLEMMERVVEKMVDMYALESVPRDEWNLHGLVDYAESVFVPPGKIRAEELQGLSRSEITERLLECGRETYEERERRFGSDVMRQLEQLVMLRVVDSKWMEHLDMMDDLREGIGLRAYGQRDPLTEYQIEAYEMFQGMVESIQEDVVKYMFKLNVSGESERRAERGPVIEHRGDGVQAGGETRAPVRSRKQVGRNDPCPCGSGKKYKKCCGKSA